MDNQFYDEICRALSSDATVSMLEWMAIHGSSVLLNWGEDDNQWECSWITSGTRFTAIRSEIPGAVKDVLGQVRHQYLEHFNFETGLWK